MEYRLEDNSALFRSMFSMVERVATGFGFTEGPVWRGDHLVFSDIPNTTVRYKPLAEGPEVTTNRHPTGNANGMTLDRQGNLIACEHTTRRVARIDASGEVTTVVDAYQGKRFNSPNDVIVRSDGTIFFTPRSVWPAESVDWQGAAVQRRLPSGSRRDAPRAGRGLRPA